MQDYYELLGVSRNASDKDIKSAYRKAALKWHPDRNKDANAEQTFKKITAAYETLSDPKKKQVYDQMGHQAYEQYGGRASAAGGQSYGSQQGPFTYTYTWGSGNGGTDFGGFSDPFDIFEQFFGGMGSRRPRRSVYQMNLTFEEAIKGIEKETVIKGQTKKIKIPAGVDDGMRIRFEEFDVQVRVQPHPYFKREDQNIILEKEITIVQATLGDSIEVPTIDGSVNLKIKPGTQPNTVVRLQGRGIPYPQQSSHKGDQYVIYKVTVPKRVSGKGRKLLEELRNEIG